MTRQVTRRTPAPPEAAFEKRPAAPAKPGVPVAVRLTDPAPPIPLLEKKVAELVALQGEHPGQDLIADIMMTALRMVRDGTTRGELKILAASLRELRYAFNIFRPYQQRRKVTVFGSARTKPGEPEYEEASLEFYLNTRQPCRLRNPAMETTSRLKLEQAPMMRKWAFMHLAGSLWS